MISPYLEMHRDDPVPWHPWGEAALAKARAEDKPIFLSVGFSTCHWCHAMARETFHDANLAHFLAQHFVCVLVDRETRPDIDEIYMAATQIYSHGGGWPNTLFLNHDLVPYFCGTYFPLEDHAKGPGFRTIAHSMAHAWAERRADVDAQAQELTGVIARFLDGRGPKAESVPPASVVERALVSLEERFDPEYGGFGQGAKFPPLAALHLLQALADSSDSDRAARAVPMLESTLDAMARGGIYDQLGGGFHRYATDRRWRRPHFEKMLAENGQLLELYAREILRTGERRWERVVRETVGLIERRFALPDGGLATALGGETGGRPGLHYRWTLEQLVDALGEEDAGFLAPILGYDGETDGGGAHVLHWPLALGEQAARRRLDPEELRRQVDPLLERLYDARQSRRASFVDRKVLADANGLAIAGLAMAGHALGEPAWIERAADHARYVRDHHWQDDALRHVAYGGTVGGEGFLADYAGLLHGLGCLAEVTGDAAWDAWAQDVATALLAHHGDPRGGLRAAAAMPEDGGDVPFVSRPVFDEVLPAPVALATRACLDLGRRLGDPAWRSAAEDILRGLAAAVGEEQIHSARMLALAIHTYHGGG